MLSHIRPLSLLLILLIIVVLFGTKRLRDIGSDLGAAFRSFRKGMSEDSVKNDAPENTAVKSTDAAERRTDSAPSKSDQ